MPFFSCPQSFSASGSFPLSWIFESSGQSIGLSASASVLPMNIQGWFPLEWTGLISLQPRDSQESSPAPQFESIDSLAISLLYGPTLTSIRDYWKKHMITVGESASSSYCSCNFSVRWTFFQIQSLKEDFLVVQWLRICLPIQGTQVWSLVREDSTCPGATKPACHNYWSQLSLCAPQQEKLLQWKACTPQRTVAPTHLSETKTQCSQNK